MKKLSLSKCLGIAAIGLAGAFIGAGQVAAQEETQDHGDYVMESAAMGFVQATIGSKCLKEKKPDGSVALVTPDECQKVLNELEAELKGASGLEEDMRQVLEVRENLDT